MHLASREPVTSGEFFPRRPSHLTTQLSDGAPASQHAGAPALVCARPPAAENFMPIAARCSAELGDTVLVGKDKDPFDVYMVLLVKERCYSLHHPFCYYARDP